MRIRIAVCDDEQAEVDYMTALVRAWAVRRDLSPDIRAFASAEALLFAYDDTAYDVMLLDIQMRGMDGVTLAKSLRQRGDASQLVFITGLPDYIAEGYEVDALHYLVKPVHPDKLCAVLDKAYARMTQAVPVLLIETDDGYMRIPQPSVLYVEAFAHTTAVYAAGQRYDARTGIGAVADALDMRAFVRCHRSYIVGIRHIHRITKTDVILDNGVHVRLSRRLYKPVNDAFIRYYRGESE